MTNLTVALFPISHFKPRYIDGLFDVDPCGEINTRNCFSMNSDTTLCVNGFARAHGDV